ncbi:protein of unknown function DUF21 [Malonomonas rubra DSM 5091]|uniref:CNNM transmembrane domain-containing protein n=1 Tax=Malonomonas rubra DSM 5091 TaxID=1122189 RepID=A0A1M6LGW8_MALRU|nr:DUF21 domain-containing protein [Malonomonas rubra]SHJ70365.1 protein of unknown function DUF21 [Malonomonas rubra DSM 5091]
MDALIWLGILFCVSQSAMFSGLNLAFFGISRLRLEIEKNHGNEAAKKVLRLREDSNFLLVTILWGNVSINVLLTLLSNSVMTGVAGFLFSTFVITLAGEITPQAYFSRHALRMASLLSPALVFYQKLLYPVTKPSAMLLDAWLGKESIQYFREKDIREILRQHMAAEETDVDHLEGTGAMNFLAIDDLLVIDEGGDILPESIIPLDNQQGKLAFPAFARDKNDPFLQAITCSNKKWAILTDANGFPIYALDTDKFLRGALLSSENFNPWSCCHIPIIVNDLKLPLGEVIMKLKGTYSRTSDDPIDKDVVLVWGEKKRIITGADILGRLLKGITKLGAATAK